MENCRAEPPSLRHFALIRSTSAAVLAFLFSAAGLQAASTWIGVTGSFSNGANWNTGEVPDGADDIEVANGGTAGQFLGDRQRGTVERGRGAGNIRFELGPTPDLLVLNGGLFGLAGPYTFDFVDAGWITNTTYSLITFSSSDIAANNFQFSNGGGFNGNFTTNGTTLQFTVTTVPEPSIWALLLVAALLAALRLRRSIGHTP